MTDHDLTKIFMLYPDLADGLRTIYNIGLRRGHVVGIKHGIQAANDGTDNTDDAQEYLESLNGNYATRA